MTVHRPMRIVGLAVVVLSLAGCGVLPWESSEESAPEVATAPPPSAQESSAAALEAKVIAAANRSENNIYFAFGGVSVSRLERAKLQQHADYLKANPDKSVTLIGYTDDLGSRSYNIAIAEQRVAAVRKLLRKYRVPGSQIRRYSVGNEKTPKICKTSQCRQKMRRVELVYSE